MLLYSLLLKLYIYVTLTAQFSILILNLSGCFSRALKANPVSNLWDLWRVNKFIKLQRYSSRLEFKPNVHLTSMFLLSSKVMLWFIVCSTIRLNFMFFMCWFRPRKRVEMFRFWKYWGICWFKQFHHQILPFLDFNFWFGSVVNNSLSFLFFRGGFVVNCFISQV